MTMGDNYNSVASIAGAGGDQNNSMGQGEFNQTMEKQFMSFERNRENTQATIKQQFSFVDLKNEFMVESKDKIQQIDEDIKNIQTIDTMNNNALKLFVIIR